MVIRDIIKARRRELGISQEDLAGMSGLSLATIKNIERGKGNPSFETITRIMEVLGMEISFDVRSPFEN
jgi:transcriptional regulator with XRE-family HTH domain